MGKVLNHFQEPPLRYKKHQENFHHELPRVNRHKVCKLYNLPGVMRLRHTENFILKKILSSHVLLHTFYHENVACFYKF
jgi:hypothetical protein